jgi:hypothetical protein
MSLALKVWWALICVEVEHVSGTTSIGSGKQVTTVRELNFAALLHLDVLEQMQTLGEHVHQKDLVLDCHNDVEATWVEGHCEGLLWQELRNLQSLVYIVPNFDRLILGASHDELLPDAHIKTCDLLGMVLAMHEIELGFLL